MSDLISRQAALDIIDSELNGWLTDDERLHLEGLAIGISDLPTIDPAENGGCLGCQYEKLGQWRMKELDKFRKYEVVCSECGAKYIGNYDAYDEPCEFNYCPNCGSRMDIE